MSIRRQIAQGEPGVLMGARMRRTFAFETAMDGLWKRLYI